MKQKKGLIHIYYGDGKGKTTTGMGLCVRAAGAGLKILIYQFMKDNESSERKILEKIDNIALYQGLPLEKFSFQMNEEEKEDRQNFYTSQFYQLQQDIEKEKYDVLFLDEVIYTIRAGLFEERLLIDFLKEKPEGLEVILTGNTPGDELIELADYVSNIKKVKHPYDGGISARIGIER
jgi:cob(I)alamin adenosyltransferase